MFHMKGQKDQHQQIFWEGKDVGWSASGHPHATLSPHIPTSSSSALKHPPSERSPCLSAKAISCRVHVWTVTHTNDVTALGFSLEVGLPLPSAGKGSSSSPQGPEYRGGLGTLVAEVLQEGRA